jgi:heat shock protein HtpX
LTIVNSVKGHMNQRQWIPIEDSSQLQARRLLAIPLGFALVVTIIFLIVGFFVGFPIPVAVVGAVISGGFMWNVYRTADDVVLKMVGGLPASEYEHARLFNVIDGLCVVGGDARPALRVVGIEYPVALAVGMPGEVGTIIVSAGFLKSMGRVEMEAVMAHVMWRLRTGDIGITTYMLALSAAVQRFGGDNVMRSVVARVTDERIVMWADVAACQATRYPPAMVSALEIVERAAAIPLGRIGAQPLWFATPDSTRDDSNQSSSASTIGFARPPLADRIAVLKEI